jgi:NADPH:quinone reductase-like Zn-dependent oxidoreductase
VLIKVESAVLNPSDILFMRGKYNIKLNLPYTPGWEGSGTIVACSPNISEKMKVYLINRRVAFIKQGEIGEYKLDGGMAEFMITGVRSIMPIPDDIDFDHGSSFFVNPLTAIGMVERITQLKSKACIVTAAAS